MNDIIKSIILGIVEGLTEFLPVSSTGHLILVNQFASFQSKEFTDAFNVIIQLGAILAVVFYFWKRINPFLPWLSKEARKKIWDTWFKTIAGVIPALLIGALAADYIEEKLLFPVPVAIALLAGGILLLYIENRKIESKITTLSGLSYKTAILIGCIQCIAMAPGVSRSAATIIGAILLGASRVVAAEFSFFLAIPTMFAASGYSLLKTGFSMTTHEMTCLTIGFFVSFFVAWLVIAAFMNFITKNNFKPFGYYRIFLALVVLGYFWIIKK